MSETLVLHFRVPTERFRDILESVKENDTSRTSSPTQASKAQDKLAQLKKPRAPYGMGPRAIRRREKAEKDRQGTNTEEPNGASHPSSGNVTPTHAASRSAPKTNANLINSGLRALDRSGKPCRKWEKKPISIRSVSTIVWKLPTWLGTPDANVSETSTSSPRSTTQDSHQEPLNESNMANPESSSTEITSPTDSMAS
ncbi:Ino80 complex subunit Ies4 [Schizosaccharomyces cryophilus OY26]|uniref:Ino80 complex subunit Ies4 n=1 Tax=Schizosaccharomyces cryophilus (strain OY26 / ATCC MYA-4695 / CBS 11777 / NBRC 106824 / NRRL Y48691) TaxID=653667 RepID=S9XA60_SCHCR|nr:Ino80 complex subunit Ies4 [Schizosaccharomyces cryophilus OY26]EPY54042.1 Ino80 complex subunit Ies4 [Schizosaccharomyces cryophilus OY26]